MKKTKSTRVYHPWHKWECYKAGFYDLAPRNGMSPQEAREAYQVFLRDLSRFEAAIIRLFKEWPNSCEQFLTNPSINRIAWIGQASICVAEGISAIHRGGYKLLTDEEQAAADALAQKYLDKWEEEHQCQLLPESISG